MPVGSLARRFHSAISLLSEEGPSSFAKALAHKVATLETYIAYRIDLDREIPPVAAAVMLDVRRAQPNDFAEFRRMRAPFPRHAQFYELWGIEECHIAFCRGVIAHVAWIYYPDQRDRHPTPFRLLRRDEAAIANCVTLSEFRGQGIYPAVLRVLLENLRTQGYRRCYMYIEAGNIASRRGVAKLGFKPVGKTWRLRFFFHADPAEGIYLRGRCR